jgi:hypothetical protein
MLRIDKSEKKLVRLTKSALADADHWERQLQAMICAEPDAFCEEIGENLWVIGQEVRPSDTVPDRIDILAVDETGDAVVIELKRGTHKLQLLQAISYAGMISRWPADKFVSTLAANFNQSPEDARAAIEDHIGPDISSINQGQRILLIAEDFDPALLVASEWLHENFGVDVRCYRLQLSQEAGNDYLTCTCIYPPIEIASLTRRGERSSEIRTEKWADWPSALNVVKNAAVRTFFETELANPNQENRLARRELIYRFDGKRRFWVGVRKERAYVFQGRRFEDDEEFWKKLLSSPQSVGTRFEGRSLKFVLVTPEDFTAFKNALLNDIKSKTFSELPENETEGEEE